MRTNAIPQGRRKAHGLADVKTSIFCVIGDPVEHSLSPAMHNAVFEHLGLNCAYVALRIKPAELGSAVRGLKLLGIKGVNVTIPHKVAVVKHLDELSEEARIIGAVNTIKFGKKAVGYNTDGIGALMALKKRGADPRGKKVLILGAGGAARAIAVTLALRGGVSSLTILGVVGREVKKLIADISKNTKAKVAGGLMDEKIREEVARADIIIHCTPVGMHPNVNETLVTAEVFKTSPVVSGLKVMDIIYTPQETRLMKEARKAGIRTVIGGLDMLVNQGAESLKIWLGIDAPLKLMRKTVVKELRAAS